MKDDLKEMILSANERGFQKAFEMAVRTETALVFARNGKIVEVKPPYRYELVKITSSKKTPKKKVRNK